MAEGSAFGPRREGTDLGLQAPLDAVVVAFRSAGSIEACIAGLKQIPGLDHIVVVDHGTDGAGEKAEALGATVVLNDLNPGFGAGQNNGLSRTRAPFVLLCNPDAVVVPEAIVAGLAWMAEQPDVAALQGTVRERDRPFNQRSSWQSVGALHLWASLLRLGQLAREPPPARCRWAPRPAPACPDGATRRRSPRGDRALGPARRFRRGRGFDPEFFLYWEDLDLSKRLRNGGWRLAVTPPIWAVHVGGASHSNPFEQEHQWWRGCMRYAALWYGTTDWITALGAATVQWFLMSLSRPPSSREYWNELLASPRNVRRHKSA